METSHFILPSRIGKPGWYNNFRDQNSLLNQSSAKMLLIGDSIISNLGRYPKIWKKCFSSHNPLNSSIKHIFILSGTNSLDHNSPEELTIWNFWQKAMS